MQSNGSIYNIYNASVISGIMARIGFDLENSPVRGKSEKLFIAHSALRVIIKLADSRDPFRVLTFSFAILTITKDKRYLDVIYI